MKIGMVGLGKMGMNLVANLIENDIEVVSYDLSPESVTKSTKIGAIGAGSLEQLVTLLPQPRIIWVMVPAGKATIATVESLAQILEPEDIVIDGGNSFYEESIALGELLKTSGVHFFDVGSSGGMNGARHGGNFMIGGEEALFPVIEPIFAKISEPNGYLYTGKLGSGHYLKMVHNGIEYGMMQAIGEGFDLLSHSPYEYDHYEVAKMWNHGSVIRSWLMELAAQAFSEDPSLDEIKGVMHSSGEGKWTVEEGLKRQVALPVISMSLMMRYRSLEEDTYTGKVVAALRNQFGGHAVDKKVE